MLRRETKRKSRGWVPFGYKYLGPGNYLHRGKPTTAGDAAAQKHDWKYDQLEKQGKKPKWVYSEEDDEFIKEVGTKHTTEWIAKNIFQAKKRLAESGWLEDIRPYQKAKRETSLNSPKDIFITPDTKRKREPKTSPLNVEQLKEYFHLQIYQVLNNVRWTLVTTKVVEIKTVCQRHLWIR